MRASGHFHNNAMFASCGILQKWVDCTTCSGERVGRSFTDIVHVTIHNKQFMHYSNNMDSSHLMTTGWRLAYLKTQVDLHSFSLHIPIQMCTSYHKPIE